MTNQLRYRLICAMLLLVASLVAVGFARGQVLSGPGFLIKPGAATLLLNGLTQAPISAYSLRKLRTAYAGSAIRVRRSSDNTEQDIGFTAGNVLDQTSLTSFCGANSGFVVTWYDQQGSTNLTQATAGNQLRIVNAGTVDVSNTKPALLAITANSTKMRATITFNTSVLSIHAVGSMNSATGAYGRLAAIGNGTADDGGNVAYAAAILRNAGANSILPYRAGAAMSSQNITLATLSTIRSTFDGTNHVTAINGTAGTAVASTGAFNSTTLVLAHGNDNTQFWDGFVSELLVFTVLPGTTDINTIQSNQKVFYSTP